MRGGLTPANTGAEIDLPAGIKDTSLMERWYDALGKEDCVKVQTLLNEDGDLVYEGWKPDVQSSVQRIGTEKIKPSKGCTALHVAARRGDVRLVRHILDMTGKMTRELRNSFLEVKHPDYELDALAMAVINGNMDIVELLTLAASREGYTPDASKVGDTNPFKPEELELQKISKEVLDEISRLSMVDTMLPKYLKSEVKEDSPKKRGKDLDRDGGSAGSHEVRETSAGSENQEDFDHKLRDRPFDHWFRQIIGYDEDCDFNFLDFHLYLFHYTFTGHFEDKYGFPWKKLHREIQKSICSKADPDKNGRLVRYLVCDLKDGQGRTPLHIAVDSGEDCSHGSSPPPHPITQFFEVIPNRAVDELVNARDSAGRTPLHRAAGLEDHSSLSLLLDNLRTNVCATVTYEHHQWGDGLDINELSLNNSFKSVALWPESACELDKSTSMDALHLAIIHKHARNVERLLRGLAHHYGRCERGFERGLPSFHCKRKLDTYISEIRSGEASSLFDPRRASALHLAVLVDDPEIVQALLKCHAENLLGKSMVEAFKLERDFPSFFVAAAIGSPSTVKLFLDSKRHLFLGSKLRQFDPFISDSRGRTALHFAMERKPKLHPHLLDFVSCQHVLSWRRKNGHKTSEDGRHLSKEEEMKEQYGQRKGCIIALLQAGIDISAGDDLGRTASPRPDAPDDFVTWWYEKVVQETEKVQKNLNDAANAISVTAALVATTSYVGPLQPPLSYAGDSSGVQMHIPSVRVFIVCDTISFYLALAAIMLALLPTLPQPRQSIFKGLQRTRMLVALALTCLFPSIISVLIAFAASSIAVVPDPGLSYHGVSISTAGVGGLICFLVIGWFSSGLFKVLKTIPVIEMTLMAFNKFFTTSRIAIKNFLTELYYDCLY